MKKVTKIESIPDAGRKKHKLRVAAYCRVSTDSDAQLESLDAQKSHYEKYILSREDWEFAGLYYDEGITGTKKDKRPELMRLMADCAARKIDFVITKSISRFSRNTTDCLELVRTLLNLNIPIFFEKENINTGSMESELFLAILSSMAEGESSSIAENSKWSVVRRFQNGTFKLSTPPYGYEWNGEEMVINQEQAQVVRRIFAETLSGKGSDAIAAGLNADEIPAQKGMHWSSTTIRGCWRMKNIPAMRFFKRLSPMGSSIAIGTWAKRNSIWPPSTTRRLSAERTLKPLLHLWPRGHQKKVPSKAPGSIRIDTAFPVKLSAASAAAPSSAAYTPALAGHTLHGAATPTLMIKPSAPCFLSGTMI